MSKLLIPPYLLCLNRSKEVVFGTTEAVERHNEFLRTEPQVRKGSKAWSSYAMLPAKASYLSVGTDPGREDEGARQRTCVPGKDCPELHR